MKTYKFEKEDILYIQTLAKKGRINTAQGDKIQAIIRKSVNPRFNMCTGCPGVVADEFRRVKSWIEIFLNVQDISEATEDNIEDLIEKGIEKLELEEEKEAEAKEKASKAEEKKREAERKKREKERKDKEKKMEAKRKERQKLRQKHKDDRAKRKEDKQKEIDALKEAKAQEAELIAEAVKDFDGDLVLDRETFEDMKAEEIIEHIEETTGIVIDIDPKSKKQIIDKALTINNTINHGIAEAKKVKEAEEAQKEAEEQAKKDEETRKENEEKFNAENGGNEETSTEETGEKEDGDNYEEMDLDALKELCTERGIEFGSRSKEKSLIEKLRAQDAESKED